MNLTSSDIEQGIFDLLQDTDLQALITGSIYKSGMRPFNSKSEDIVVTFLSGLSNQIQVGIVNINTYVPNIAINGIDVKNTARCKEIETEIKNWLSELSDIDYKIELDRTIQVFEQAEINQHFINTRIKFKLLI